MIKPGGLLVGEHVWNQAVPDVLAERPQDVTGLERPTSCRSLGLQD